MNKLFLIILPSALDRVAVIKHLEETGIITFWFYNLPSCFFARSIYMAADIHKSIVTKFPHTDRLFVTQVNSSTDLSGTVPDDHAPLFNNR